MSMSEKLRDALRKKFRSPQEALASLGLDSALLDDKETKPMPTVLSPKAMYAKGRISGYLAPRLAADTALDLNPILAPVTAKNWRAQQPIIESAIRRVTRGNLARDADVTDLVELLDAIGETREGEDDLEPNSAPLPHKDDDDDEDEDEWRDDHDYRARDARRRLGRDESEEETREREERESAQDAKRRLGRDESEEEAMDRRARDVKARDARRAKDEETDKEKKKREEAAAAADEPPPFKGKPEVGGAITQSAMDAALARQRAEIISEQREIQVALNHVHPRVGVLNLAFDSAEAVYRHALEVLHVPEAKTIHASALKTVLDLLPRPSAKPALIATDAAGVKSFAERFPHAAATKISY